MSVKFDGTLDKLRWTSNQPKLNFADGPYTVHRAPMSMWPDREELNRRLVLSHVVKNRLGSDLVESSESCCNDIAEFWNLKHAEWIMLKE